MVGVPVIETGLFGYKPNALTFTPYPINRTSLLSDAGVPGGEKSRPGAI